MAFFLIGITNEGQILSETDDGALSTTETEIIPSSFQTSQN